MWMLIEISEESYNKLMQKSMLMSASAIDEAVDAVKKGRECKGWIPIKFREMTAEEKERYKEYCDTDEFQMYDCRLPEYGEEVLITTQFGEVTTDVFMIDGTDGNYFEKYYGMGEVIAWMPLPEAYKGGNS